MYKNLPKNVLESLNKKLQEYPLVDLIIKKIFKFGGKSFLVGGAVRDLFLELPIKDLDIEVYGLSAKKLEEIVKSFGPVNLVGKVFGVYRLNNLDVDWSLPREDTSGRKPLVKVDPYMSIENAFRRRDLTINSMGIDLIEKKLVDPFNGLKDLKNKTLRATDPKFFVEDPLRFYRVMQFIGRFNMQPDKELNKICTKMDITKVSKERVDDEFKKLFLKSIKPSTGIDWLRTVNKLSFIFPEIYALINVLQDPKWHPEGDAYEHTLQSIDAAAILEYKDEKEKLILLWATLCHDLGKAKTTQVLNNKVISYEHDKEGEELTKNLLKRITRKINMIKSVCLLVRYHMLPIVFVQEGAKSSAYKRLAKKLFPYANLNMLAKLALADKLGRNPKKGTPLKGNIKEIEKFVKKAKELNILEGIENPILKGRDLIDIIKPGPLLGKLVKKAYEIQLEEGIKDKQKLKQKVLKLIEK